MLQIFTNSLLAGAIFALVGVGFSLAYQVSGCLNFTHGFLVTAGAYGLYLFRIVLGLPWFFAIPLALASCIVLGVILNVGVFGPLRRSASSPLAFLLASLGAYIVLQNVISLAFGDRIQTVWTGSVLEATSYLGARLTPIQLVTITVAFFSISVLHVLMRASRVGLRIRACSDNPDCAAALGISMGETFLQVTVVSSCLAGAAGCALAADIGMTPTMGMQPLMMGIVAMVVGGMRSVAGVAAGALLLALAVNLAAWYVGAQWQDTIAFLLLLLFLLFRPQGISGKALRKASV